MFCYNRLSIVALTLAASSSLFCLGSPLDTVTTETGLTHYHPPINVTEVYYNPETRSNNTDITISTRATIFEDIFDYLAAASVIASNDELASLVCTEGGIVFCLAAVAIAGIANYLTLWYYTEEVASKRSLLSDIIQVNIYPQWTATAACNTACKILTDAPANTWTPLGNTTVGSSFFDVHVYHDGVVGGLRGLMMFGGGNTTTAAFYFEDDSEMAALANKYVDSGEFENWYGSEIGGFAEANNAQVMCANLWSSNGTIGAGVWAFGLGEEAYNVTDATLQLEECAAI